MARKGKVDWFEKDVVLEIERASDKSITAIAHRIEERTKTNITNNDQVDTGFMKNSVYVVTPTEDGYDETWPDGRYRSKKTERMVSQKRAPKADRGKAQAIVAVGAEYAIYPELQNSFLYRAVEQTAGEVSEAEIKEVARSGHLTR